MIEFFNALTDPDLDFLRNSLIVGILSSAAFGITGSFVVVKRISYIAGAISHCVLGGIGAALFLGSRFGITWLTPVTGAAVAAVLAAFLIGSLNISSKERSDSVIGAVWVTGMALGIILIEKTPGYVQPMSYLFGNILMVTRSDISMVLFIDIVIITLSVLFYNKLMAVCFDEEFIRLRGVKTWFYYILLLTLTALTIVLLVRIVGIIMVIALLTLPASTVSRFTLDMKKIITGSALLCMVYMTAGIYLSYTADLPSGGTIVIIAGGVYLLAFILEKAGIRA